MLNNAPEILWTTSVAPSENQVSSSLGDESVVLHLGSGMYFGLNSVAASVWNLLQRQRQTVSSIVRAIASEYEVEERECTQDIIDLIRQMNESGLVDLQ